MASIETASEFRANMVGAAHKALMSSLAYSRGEQIRVMIEDLHVLDGFNPRIDSGKLKTYIRSLANKIKANGFYDHKPLSVYGHLKGKRPVLIVHDGHCRLAAVKLAISEGAEITDLPVVIKDRSCTEEDLLVGMVTSNDGRPLSALERAIVCKRLVNFGWKHERIAANLDLTTDYVDKLLILSGAPAEIRDMVERGQVSAALATQMLVRHGSDAVGILQKELARAQAAGQVKVLPRNMPERARRRAIATAAPRMLDVLQQVMRLQASLPADLRKAVADVLSEVPSDEEGGGTGNPVEREFRSRQLQLVA